MPVPIGEGEPKSQQRADEAQADLPIERAQPVEVVVGREYGLTRRHQPLFRVVEEPRCRARQFLR